MQVLAPPLNQRLMVLNAFTGEPGWVDVAGIGPVLADDGMPAVPAVIAQSAPPAIASDSPVPDVTLDSPVPIGSPGMYTVQPGDSLKDIAVQVNSSVTVLITANPGINADSLTIGQQLHVPNPAP